MLKSDFLAYKVKPNETIFSVANRLKIHPVDLKAFHNQIASPTGDLLFDHFQGIEYLYIPSNHRNEAAIAAEKEKEKPHDFFESSFYKNLYLVIRLSTPILEKEEALLLKLYNK